MLEVEPRELPDVLAALAQRWCLDPHDVQAVVQILAEAARGDGLREILVRRGDHPDVDADRRLAADAEEFAFREHAQQPRLKSERHVADLVQEQRAAVRLLEPADPPLGRARERAFLVTEELRLEQLRGDRRRVQRDERRVRARRVVVQGPRDELLAGARFAGNQHSHARARQPADRLEHVLHRGRLADDPRRRLRLGLLCRAARSLPRRARYELHRFVDVERLRQVLERAALVRGHRAVQVGVRRDHDHRDIGIGPREPLHELEAAHIGHSNVGHEHVGPIALERGEELPAGIERARNHVRLLQRLLEHPAHRLVVVDDPNAQPGRRHQPRPAE